MFRLSFGTGNTYYVSVWKTTYHGLQLHFGNLPQSAAGCLLGHPRFSALP